MRFLCQNIQGHHLCINYQYSTACRYVGVIYIGQLTSHYFLTWNVCEVDWSEAWRSLSWWTVELETGYLSSYSGHHQFIFSFQAQGRQAVRVTLYTQGDKMSLVELQCGTATYAATVSHPEFPSALGVAVGVAVPTICSSTRHVTRSTSRLQYL